MLQWGILSTGRIASVFARGVLQSKRCKVVAVASRNKGEAERFGIDKHGDFFKNEPGIARYGSYEEMLADRNVQAVYVATPHPLHALWAIRCAEAGKHVLCEKPLAINHADAMAIFEAARAHNVFAMEAFMYRCHPAMKKVLELVKSGAIGQVRAIQSTFGFNAGPNWSGRLLANDLGGGGILDVGCYPMSFIRAVAGAALGTDGPAEPSDLRAVGQITQTGVDGYTAASVRFESPWGGIVANIACAVQVAMESVSRVYGTDGQIYMPRWVPNEKENKIFLIKGSDTTEHVCEGAPGETAYTMEADEVARAVAAGETQGRFPAMSWADSLGNMRGLDLWRVQIALTYESERPERLIAPVWGRPLRLGENGAMKYGRIAGLDKDVARIVMGVDNQMIDKYPHAANMFDDYYARGGNCFDTAYIYGNGRCEQAVGAWIKSRNVREQVVVLAKGAHTPFCDPASLEHQLNISLDRLHTDHADIYMLHRDNPQVPISEFVDVLNRLHKAGRIKAFGGSNWTAARMDAFNADAKARGLVGMTAVSNNLALAVMNDPVWAGCLTAHEPAFMAWLEKKQIALMPWSSQARGFFVWANTAYTVDRDLVRCWYSPQNFERLNRARELAEKKNCLPIQIALAWVLHQPFPTFALIGPRVIDETRTSLEALKVDLTPAEVKWLDLQT